MENRVLLEKLAESHKLSADQWRQILGTYTDNDREYAASLARDTAIANFGREIFFRGLIEFSNYCRNDCYYCGIRRSNRKCHRYRLDKEEILDCCRGGYAAGYRTFVLQGGEDPHFTDIVLTDIVETIRERYPDCAITLSVGERSRESYSKLFAAGADRYLLRHETADESHYGMLHPPEMSWKNRIRCLQDLRDIGFQVGCGLMVGSPWQRVDCLVKDMLFIESFRPEMIGIGPFVPHKDTPFKDKPAGSSKLTLFLLSLCRLMLPQVLLPATTALTALDKDGRQMGVLAGANVAMPNISPMLNRKNYSLYNNKPLGGADPAEAVSLLWEQMAAIGYTLKVGRGDYKK